MVVILFKERIFSVLMPDHELPKRYGPLGEGYKSFDYDGKNIIEITHSYSEGESGIDSFKDGPHKGISFSFGRVEFSEEIRLGDAGMSFPAMPFEHQDITMKYKRIDSEGNEYWEEMKDIAEQQLAENCHEISTIGELRKLLEGIPDDTPLLTGGFDESPQMDKSLFVSFLKVNEHEDCYTNSQFNYEYSGPVIGQRDAVIIDINDYPVYPKS